MTERTIMVIGWTLLHFLWEGAVVGIFVAACLRALKSKSAEARYAAACAGLILMGALPILTFVALRATTVGTKEQFTQTRSIFFGQASGSAATEIPRNFESLLPIVVLLWAVGVLALAIRLVGGIVYVERLRRRQSEPAPQFWIGRMERLTVLVGLRKRIDLRQSMAVIAPSAMGVFRATVIVPASFFASLPADQLEALLIHELAHIRRHDYLVNLIQSFLETVLFYHPAIWLVSKAIRNERENCCDDLTVRAIGNPLLFARALTNLEEWRHSSAVPLLSASGGTLMQRINRIVTPRPIASGRAPHWAVVASIAISAAVAGTVLAQTGVAPKPPQHSAKPKAAAPSRHTKHTLHHSKPPAATKIVVQVRPTPSAQTFTGLSSNVSVSAAPLRLSSISTSLAVAAPQATPPNESTIATTSASPIRAARATLPTHSQTTMIGITPQADSLPPMITRPAAVAARAQAYPRPTITAALAATSRVTAPMAATAKTTGPTAAPSARTMQPAKATSIGRAASNLVNLSARNADFSETILDVATRGEISMVVTSGVYPKVSLNLVNMRPLEAMMAICRAAGATYRVEGDVYYITLKPEVAGG